MIQPKQDPSKLQKEKVDMLSWLYTNTAAHFTNDAGLCFTVINYLLNET